MGSFDQVPVPALEEPAAPVDLPSGSEARRLTARWWVTPLVGFGMLCAAAVAGLYIGAVRTRSGQRVDEAAIVGRSGDQEAVISWCS